MAQYQFAGCLYRNVAEMCDAIAQAHLSADGCNSNEAIKGFLAEETDAELAADVIKDWFSEFSADDEDHREDRTFDQKDLERAFKRLRDPEAFKDAFGEDSAE